MIDTPTSSAGGPAGPALQRLTPRALLEVKRIVDPQIHPDGQRVAFCVQEADFDESRWVSHAWITEWSNPADYSGQEISDTDGTETEAEPPPGPDELTRQLTFSAEGESDPRWSPDGRHLAFMSARPDLTIAANDEDEDEEPIAQIWALPVDGGEARKITSVRDPIIDFAWAPDGQTLIYLTLEPRSRPLQGVRRERERRKIDPVVEHDDPRRRQFFAIDLHERKPRLLFTGDFGTEAFALAPDGEHVAYLTNYTGEDNDYHIADLYVRSMDSGATVKLIRRAGGKYRLRWSPDGRHIAFLSWHDPNLSFSRESIYSVETPSVDSLRGLAMPEARLVPAAIASDLPNLQERTRFAESMTQEPGIAECVQVGDLDTDIIAYEWIDNETVLALAARGTATEIVKLGVTGRPLQDGGATAALNANGDRRDLAVDIETGRAVFVEETAQSPPEITLLAADGRTFTLTEINRSFRESYRLPKQEVVAWRSTDGTLVEGLLTYPADFESAGTWPLLIAVHGGPKGRAVNALLDYTMPAVWAAEGYLVLRPNYRGSEGYGHSFAVANRRDLGGQDYRDVIAGADWCIEQGLADPQRLGILGGSYGGYLVNWTIGQTNRFRAAISMFGIFDLRTDFSNSRLSRWERDYLAGLYWDDPEIYRKLSPSTYLSNISTPTLILHGEEDDNTSISNSQELYRALVERGVEAQFVHYPREGHGIQEPNHRLDELRRSLAWMDRYLKGDGLRPATFRVGDLIPDLVGSQSLCISSADASAFVGRAECRPGQSETALLEVTIALSRINPVREHDTLTLSAGDIRLTLPESPARVVLPFGVAQEGPGGKIVVETAEFSVCHTAERDVPELSLAVTVVFRVPGSGEGLLRVLDFPSVSVLWTADREGEESKLEEHPVAQAGFISAASR